MSEKISKVINRFSQQNKSTHTETSVSGLTCEKLGSCHSHPCKMIKANQTENQQPFLDSSEN